MLKIIEGSFFSGGREKIREEIKNAFSLGKRTVLIVPEQQTVIAESEFAGLLPDSAPLAFEVTNFTRLANSVFRTLGGVDKEYCDRSRSALIMWRTLSELSPELSLTAGNREINYGMVKRALATTGETENLAISGEELSLARERLASDGRLDQKLEDLVKITSLYKKLLSERYADSGEDISSATRMLSERTDVFSDTLFFIEGFTSFTEPQYKLMAELIKRTEISVLLNIPKASASDFEYTEPRATRERLLSLAKRHSSEIKLIRLDGRIGAPEELTEIVSLLWKTTGKIDNKDLHFDNRMKIYEAETSYDACDFIAADIRRKVMLGASYSDFAVVTGDISRYAGILDTAASRCDIPLFISSARDLSSFEAIKLIYSAYRSVTGDFRREDVISYAKCGLSGITREECDVFEIYTEKWQISGRRFYDSVVWNMNPDGYTAFKRENADAELIRLNEIRKTIITPLINLKEGMQGARTVRDYAEVLYAFITDISLCDRIAERIDELFQLGEDETAKENEKLYRIICDSLDTLVEVSGDEKTDPEGFIAQLKIVFSSVTVSKIPTFTDSVTAGSADMLRLSGKKHVYMLGVNRGEFPAPAAEDSYFTERDKEQLKLAGLPFEPDALLKEARELYSFSRALSYASETVSIIYSNKDTDFSPCRRSDVIERILEITDGAVSVKKLSQMPVRDLIYSPTDALEALGKISDADYPAVREALIEAGYSDTVRTAELKTENDSLSLSDKVLSLIYKNELELTQSKIDSYNTCPLAYFCRYNLRLDEDERAEFDARNIGSFVHAMLENFFSLQIKSGLSVKELDSKARESMLRAAAESYLEQVIFEKESETKRTSLLIERLIRSTAPIVEGLCEEFSESDYTPKYFELRIGGRGEKNPEMLTFTDDNGNKTLIKGSIDRVDAFKYGDDVYIRVVDYKTGRKEFKPSDLEKGKNLQMFLYLRAVVDSKNSNLHDDLGVGKEGRLIPAGVIYVKSDLSDVKISHASADEEISAVKGDQKRQGMLLDDSVSIGAMNLKFLPIKINANGSYSKTSLDKLYSHDEWETLSRTVERSVRRVTDKMRSGNISASPMIEKRNSPCNYCKFKPMCRNAKIK